MSAGTPIALDPLSLATGSSGVVFLVLVVLVLAAAAVWFIGVLKLLQLRRWANAQKRFEEEAALAEHGDTLIEIARHHADAPGARIVSALSKRRKVPLALEGVARRAIVDEQQRAQKLMSALASIGSAAPFVGLFGTVWGIMDAFLRIGREKSASLPVVAPAIGEALIATAVGLFAAIPAVIVFNALNKRIDDLLSAVEASALGWLALVTEGAPPRPSSQSLLPHALVTHALVPHALVPHSLGQPPNLRHPIAQQPIAQQPIAQQPIAQQPIAQQPIAQQPVAQQPVAQQPVAAPEEFNRRSIPPPLPRT